MKGKNLLSISDLTAADIRLFISNAVELKARDWLSILDKKIIALIFEKPSLRTRVSFEVAAKQLGGECLYLSPAEVGLGERESIPDVARVLSRYVNGIVARTFTHQTVETLAEYASVPVINALSDQEHPCQALADLLTIHEQKGELDELTLAYIGDGNNVANSLLLAASLSGMNFRIASPPGYAVQGSILALAQNQAKDSGAKIFSTEDPELAVSGADIVYTDVWTSMGQEVETEKRLRAFTGYQVNSKLLAAAKKDSLLMHPLPAHHGLEVSRDILDSQQSVIFDQAENRVHLQKALLSQLLGGLSTPLTDYH